MNTAIAQHLNVTEAAIVKVEEWANVLFCVVRGIGARFVSKKVLKMYEFHEVIDNKTAAGTKKKSVIVLPVSGEWPANGIDVSDLRNAVESRGYKVVDFNHTRGDIFGLADIPCPIFELA